MDFSVKLPEGRNLQLITFILPVCQNPRIATQLPGPQDPPNKNSAQEFRPRDHVGSPRNRSTPAEDVFWSPARSELAGNQTFYRGKEPAVAAQVAEMAEISYTYIEYKKYKLYLIHGISYIVIHNNSYVLYM